MGSRDVRSRVARRAGHVALLVALAVVPVLALNSFATADTGSDPGASPSVSQRQCLADQGATLPDRARTTGVDDPAPLTDAQRQQLRRAAEACGFAHGRPHLVLHPLTDAQRQCLADHGVTRPAPGADGVRQPLSAAQREALRQAAAACGLPLLHPPRATGATGTV